MSFSTGMVAIAPKMLTKPPDTWNAVAAPGDLPVSRLVTGTGISADDGLVNAMKSAIRRAFTGT